MSASDKRIEVLELKVVGIIDALEQSIEQINNLNKESEIAASMFAKDHKTIGDVVGAGNRAGNDFAKVLEALDIITKQIVAITHRLNGANPPMMH